MSRFELDLKTLSNKLLKHVIITIKNTKADLLTKLFHTNPDKYLYLIEGDARPLLNSFKKDLENLDEDYSMYPTYNHTEVDVECCEAMVALRKGDVFEAKRQISLAKRRYTSIVRSGALNDYPYLQTTGEFIAELLRQANTNIQP